MIYVRNTQDQRLLDFSKIVFRDQVNMDINFKREECITKAVDEDGQELLAVIIFHDYIDRLRMEMSIAAVSPKWCNRRVLFECFDFCFNICGVQRIYTQVMGPNEQALSLNKRLGFELIADLPDFQKDIDGNALNNQVFTMTKEQCRWIK